MPHAQPNGNGSAHKGDNEYDNQNLVYLPHVLGSVLDSENLREFKGF